MATQHPPAPVKPMAVVGMSFRMPQGIVDDSSFWDVLVNRKNLMTKWPESRFKVDSFQGSGDDKKPNTVRRYPFITRLFLSHLGHNIDGHQVVRTRGPLHGCGPSYL